MVETRSADDAARANSPAAVGDTPAVVDRVAPGAPPPAANQGAHEPATPALEAAPDAGTIASDHPQSPAALPRDEVPARLPGSPGRAEVPIDPVVELDAVRTAPGAPPESVPGTSGPGNAQGVSVPATESAPGTSQQSNIVEGVRASPGAVPLQPDGEADTGG